MPVEEPAEETPQAKAAPAPAKSAAPVIPAVKDLSEEISRLVEREPSDQVRCVRVFGNYYRCNWWTRGAKVKEGLDFDWAGLITDHIRKSRFLMATTQSGQVIIEEVKPKTEAAR